MAQTLLAILIMLAIVLMVPRERRLRGFRWLRRRRHGAADEGRAATRAWLIAIAAFVACAVVQSALAGVAYGLPALAFAVVVLLYSWGPRELDSDVDAVLHAPDADARVAAAQDLRDGAEGEALPFTPGDMIDAVFRCALARWFGVLFWFVVLGPAGALGYRMIRILAGEAVPGEPSEGQSALFERARHIVDWIPAHLMALTLALVSDFDSVIRAWRRHVVARGDHHFALDSGFLAVVARAGIDADVLAGDEGNTNSGDPLVVLADARAVVRRILVAWIVAVALLVLAGWLA